MRRSRSGRVLLSPEEIPQPFTKKVIDEVLDVVLVYYRALVKRSVLHERVVVDVGVYYSQMSLQV